MKKILPLLAIAFLLTACKDTWPQDYKDQYHSDCMTGPLLQSVPDEKKKPYCDCVLEKTIAKYPSVNDLLEHAAELPSDPEIQKCKDLLQ